MPHFLNFFFMKARTHKIDSKRLVRSPTYVVVVFNRKPNFYCQYLKPGYKMMKLYSIYSWLTSWAWALNSVSHFKWNEINNSFLLGWKSNFGVGWNKNIHLEDFIDFFWSAVIITSFISLLLSTISNVCTNGRAIII